MLTVYGTRPSRTFRVLWALEEMGLDYAFEKTWPQSEAMFAVNPLGQAPALRDGDHVLIDSIAILYYLTERHGALTYPPGSLERARMDARVSFLITEVDAPIWLMGRHGFVLPEDQRLPGMRAVAEADLGRAERKFERLLGRGRVFRRRHVHHRRCRRGLHLELGGRRERRTEKSCGARLSGPHARAAHLGQGLGEIAGVGNECARIPKRGLGKICRSKLPAPDATAKLQTPMTFASLSALSFFGLPPE